MIDLTTRYLGMSLANPLVASAGPMTGEVEKLQRLQDAGIGAAVLPSLFEEQIAHDEYQISMFYEGAANSSAESLSYFPELGPTGGGPDQYLKLVSDAKAKVSIPIIASLNGSLPGGWTRYAKRIEEAGADALELNVYYIVTDITMTAQEVESRYVELVESVRETISIPLAIKMAPRFSSIPNFAKQMVDAGADGLVLFNRYRAPDIDLDSLTVRPEVVLSSPHEVRLPLRWIAILRDQIPVSLAASTGIHTAAEIAKALLVGADVTMMTSALIKNGPGIIEKNLEDLRSWMKENEYQSVEQLKGSMSLGNCPDPSVFERANYMKALVEFVSDR